MASLKYKFQALIDICQLFHLIFQSSPIRIVWIYIIKAEFPWISYLPMVVLLTIMITKYLSQREIILIQCQISIRYIKTNLLSFKPLLLIEITIFRKEIIAKYFRIAQVMIYPFQIRAIQKTKRAMMKYTRIKRESKSHEKVRKRKLSLNPSTLNQENGVNQYKL
jgi:hypothetical protein